MFNLPSILYNLTIGSFNTKVLAVKAMVAGSAGLKVPLEKGRDSSTFREAGITRRIIGQSQQPNMKSSKGDLNLI